MMKYVFKHQNLQVLGVKLIKNNFHPLEVVGHPLEVFGRAS